MSSSKTRRAAVLAIVGSTLALPAYAYTGEEYASQAKITITQARKIALRAYPGKIVAEELEKESGGSGLRYSFDIAGAKGVHEVGIDARAGAVIENSKEGPHPD